MTTCVQGRGTPVVTLAGDDHAPIALEALRLLRTDLDDVDDQDLKPDLLTDGKRRTWRVRIAPDRILSVVWQADPPILDDHVRVVCHRSGGTRYEIKIHDGAPDGWRVEDWLETISLEAIAMIEGPHGPDLPAIADAVATDYAVRHGSRTVHLILPSPWGDGAVDAEAGKGPPSSRDDAATTADMEMLPRGIGVHARIEPGAPRRIQCILSPVERKYDASDPVRILRLAAVLDAARRSS